MRFYGKNHLIAVSCMIRILQAEQGVPITHPGSSVIVIQCQDFFIIFQGLSAIVQSIVNSCGSQESLNILGISFEKALKDRQGQFRGVISQECIPFAEKRRYIIRIPGEDATKSHLCSCKIVLCRQRISLTLQCHDIFRLQTEDEVIAL